MATKKQDDLEALLGEATDPAPEAPPAPPQHDQGGTGGDQTAPLKGVDPKSPPWGPEMFASAAYHRSRFGAEWNDRVAEADDATIAETFALASRLKEAMTVELASRLTPETARLNA